jgi:16S rRNA A1518/A1519 N6-dimethyltransferase RsmA/KsgA/DIM1 with predicted DNA glycosylase/AP lyase activity
MKSGLQLGVNPKTERQENDFYATNPKALELFLNEFEEGLRQDIWEVSCGQGHLSKVLESEGYLVKSTDLIDRGFGNGNIDFLQHKNSIYNCDIITNPPFKLAEEFLKNAMEIQTGNGKVIFLLKIQFLEGIKRKELFKKYPPKYVYCHSSRQQCSKDGNFDKYKATTQFYAWFVWEKGFTGDTVIRWI